MVPGSHKMPGGPKFAPGAEDPEGAVELKLRAGTAIIFQQGVWHAGAPNHSSQTRVSLVRRTKTLMKKRRRKKERKKEKPKRNQGRGQ